MTIPTHPSDNATSPADPRPRVWPAQSRATVQARFPDGAVFEAPVGTPLEAFIQAVPAGPLPIMAAVVHGKLRELNTPLESDTDVIPISRASSDGARIYQRSLTFLMVVAAHERFPDASIVVDHSMPFGGLFCAVEGRAPFTPEELAELDAGMRKIVAADEPITRSRVSVDDAIAIFEHEGYLDKVRLLQHFKSRVSVTIYTLRGMHGYYYGHMAPSTRYLTDFALQPAADGFILSFPHRSRPGFVPRYPEHNKLTAVFREHLEWMQVMHVEDVGSLNDAVQSGRIREVVLVDEALHEHRIADIAEAIAKREEPARLVLIAGPSSSGKTTFSKRLAVQLLTQGLRPVPIELDSYFVDLEHTPRDEFGAFDFEALGALDLDLFNQQLLQLMAGEEVVLPDYNFETGLREPGSSLRVTPDSVIIVEGIHGLNPNLVAAIPPRHVFRIYASALTQLNVDSHNRIPTTDVRLIRRIVRDASYRGYTALQAIARWESVLAGERRNIFPYQDNADEFFNSALLYELAVLKPFVEPLLRQIEAENVLEYLEARRLLAFLSWFLPCSDDLVPDNSLLREFIGNSNLAAFSY